MFEKRKIEDNKAFKALAVNDITRIAAEANKNGQDELAERLRSLLRQIDQTPITASTELPFFYVAIRRYVMDITDDLAERNFHTATIRMKEFESVVKELAMIADQSKLSLSSRENKNIARVEGRLEKFAKKSKIKIKKDYSPKQISVETLYPNETIAELRLAGLQDRLDRANSEMDALRNSKDYGSQLVKGQKQNKKAEIEMIKQLIQISNNAMFRENQVELIKAASEEVKAEYAYQTKKFNKEQEEILSEWEAIKAKHGLKSDAEAGLGQDVDSDLEEKFYELMKDVEYINKELVATNKEMGQILRRVKDLSDDMNEAKGSEKNLIAGQIRDLQIKYRQLDQKNKLLTQKKVDSQAAYEVLARNKDFDEIQERYAGISASNLAALQSLAVNLNEKIDQANQLHESLDEVVGTVLVNDIQTGSALDTDMTKVGDDFGDIADFVALAEEEEG